MGHTVTPNGVKKDDKKIEAIKEWPVPKNVKDLRRFLGLTGYLRKYVPHYAQWVNPLSGLLKGYSNKRGNRSENRKREEELWKWGITENNSFQLLKREVCKQVELAYADFEKPFRISTDASMEGLGAVLEQQDDIGNWRPLAYGSRRVTDAEKRYNAHKLEFLALKWAVTEQFSEYLTSSKFTVFTDNNPLTYNNNNNNICLKSNIQTSSVDCAPGELTHAWYILKKTHLDAIAQRWVAALADYDFEIIYKPGIENGVADAISRRYDEERDDTNNWIEWATRTTKNFKRDGDDCETVMKIQTQMNIDWKEEQKHGDIRMIMDLIHGSHEKETSNKVTSDQRKMRRILSKLFMHNELLYYREDVEGRSGGPKKVAKTDSNGIPRKWTFWKD